MTEQQQPAGQLEYRAATQIGVSFPHRTIELVVMPYEEETLTEYKGRMIREIVHRGAFDGIERRANRVKVNREHDVRAVCGKAVAFHPSRQEGLVAELYMSKTEIGEQTLTLADEGILDASAGFLPFADGGEHWEGRSTRHLNKLWLGHIAMTADPAYEGARVLDVRAQSVPDARGAVVAATPNLHTVRGWRLADQYDLTDR